MTDLKIIRLIINIIKLVIKFIHIIPIKFS